MGVCRERFLFNVVSVCLSRCCLIEGVLVESWVIRLSVMNGVSVFFSWKNVVEVCGEIVNVVVLFMVGYLVYGLD